MSSGEQLPSPQLLLLLVNSCPAAPQLLAQQEAGCRSTRLLRELVPRNTDRGVQRGVQPAGEPSCAAAASAAAQLGAPTGEVAAAVSPLGTTVSSVLLVGLLQPALSLLSSDDRRGTSCCSMSDSRRDPPERLGRPPRVLGPVKRAAAAVTLTVTVTVAEGLGCGA
jgi:hypothetical protein